MTIDEKLSTVGVAWLDILSTPVILIPLVGGLVLGFIVSLSPFIRYKKRKSDRAFYVYLTNMIASGGLFIITQWEKDLMAVLSMLILVVSSSVALPWWFFRDKVKRNDDL